MEKDFFQRIVDWANERCILSQPFNHEKEVSFIVEELLESTGVHDSKSSREEAEKIAKNIIKNIDKEVNPEKIVDAFADIIVFSIGTIAKLGYNPSKVMDEVHKEINSRTGKIINGKFEKDSNIKMYKANFDSCK